METPIIITRSHNDPLTAKHQQRRIIMIRMGEELQRQIMISIIGEQQPLQRIVPTERSQPRNRPIFRAICRFLTAMKPP